MPLELPTEKSPRSLTARNAKVLLHGFPKIGKTMTVAQIAPEHTLFLAAEPGQGGQEVYKVDITCWEDFKQAYELLKNAKADGTLKFETLAIDTVDQLYRMCQDNVVKELGIKHPSDLEWGKGWQALSDRWRLAMGALAGLGLGLWFVSHSKDEEIKQAVGTRTRTVPTIKGSAREFLIGFCDYILYAAIEHGESGPQRVIHANPSEDYEAGGRYTLPDPLPLNGPAIVKAMEQAAEVDHSTVPVAA